MLKAGYISDRGLVRENNEDNLYADTEEGIFIVADGMGGHNAGEAASEIAIEQVQKEIKEGLSSSGDVKVIIEDAIKEANKRVYKKAGESELFYGMGTTMVTAVAKGERLYIGYVGDSRAYMLDNKGLQPLTEDHTVAMRMLKEGKIKRDELRGHPMSHVLTRAVGTQEYVEPAIMELPYQGETVLLCSDGLTDMVEDEEIAEVLLTEPDLQKAYNRLAEMAKEHGGRDNITVVVFAGENKKKGEI